MKLLTIILAAAFAFSTPCIAAKGDKKAGKRAEGRKALKAFDRNRNQQIDGAEMELVKTAYGTLKQVDANSDGVLDDAEIKALNAKTGAGKGKAKKTGNGKKKRKKAQ
jgi:hypothetical protein